MKRAPPPATSLPAGFRSAVSYMLGVLAVIAFVSTSLPRIEGEGSREGEAATVALGLLLVAGVWTLVPRWRWGKDWRRHVGLTAAVYLLMGYYMAAVVNAAYDPWWRLMVSFLWMFHPFVLIT